MTQILSVTELNSYLSRYFEQNPRLQDVRVQGEISNMKAHSSGHWYFSVKDKQSALKCVMFKSAAQRQDFTPRDGDLVTVRGRIGIYLDRGEYQLYAESMQKADAIGDLYQQFEALKLKLQAEGLFDSERKRPLHPFPQKIGIVTSSEAAALQDVLNVLRQRFPLAEVILSPTLVQGQEAPPQIIQALHKLTQRQDIQTILICRGGGSIEDLWCFNDESLARAIAASPIPIVSGIGHEVDFTIADFVADVRAPTPSAAAMLATPDLREWRDQLQALEIALDTLMADGLDQRRADLNTQERHLSYLSPAINLRRLRQRLDDWTERLDQRQQQRLSLLRERLTARAAALHALNPEAILARGYAIVRQSTTHDIIASKHAAKPGDGITIRLKDGELKARVEDEGTHERYKRTLF